MDAKAIDGWFDEPDVDALIMLPLDDFQRIALSGLMALDTILEDDNGHE